MGPVLGGTSADGGPGKGGEHINILYLKLGGAHSGATAPLDVPTSGGHRDDLGPTDGTQLSSGSARKCWMDGWMVDG